MKRISRIVLAAALLAGGGLFGVAAQASAEDPPGYNGASVTSPSTSTPTAGQALSLTIKGFGASEYLKVVLNSDPVTLLEKAGPTDSSGGATISVTIPSNTTAGSHTITVTGLSTGRTASFPITVKAASSSGSGVPTGNTGGLVDSPVNPLLPIAAGAVLLIGVVALSRRRAAAQH
jgi:hypothetical protein